MFQVFLPTEVQNMPVDQLSLYQELRYLQILENDKVSGQKIVAEN